MWIDRTQHHKTSLSLRKCLVLHHFQVYDGNNESSLALHPASGFTGGQRPKVTIRSRTGQMLVKLVTSASCADVGFRAIYSKGNVFKRLVIH